MDKKTLIVYHGKTSAKEQGCGYHMASDKNQRVSPLVDYQSYHLTKEICNHSKECTSDILNHMLSLGSILIHYAVSYIFFLLLYFPVFLAAFLISEAKLQSLEA